MAHIGALPGTPLYDADGGMAEADRRRRRRHREAAGRRRRRHHVRQRERPALSLQGAAGRRRRDDRGDQARQADAEGALRRQLSVGSRRPAWPSPRATGASFVREIFTGVFASDMGLWEPDAAAALRLRRNLGRPDLKLLFNINAEFADSLDQRPIELRARSAVFSSLADAHPGLRPADRPAGATSRTCARSREALQGTCRSSPTPASARQCARDPRRSPTAASSARISRSTATPGTPVDGDRVKRFMDVVERCAERRHDACPHRT